jgi:chromosome segregation ATPase
LRETLAQEIKKMEAKKSQVKVKEVNVAVLKQTKAKLNTDLTQLRTKHKSSEDSIAEKENMISNLDCKFLW